MATESVDELIRQLVPGLESAAQAVAASQHTLAARIISDGAMHESIRLVSSQAINDVVLLLGDLQAGRGRSAIRTSRALIEHAVNMYTITSSLCDAQRYLEHLDLGLAMMLEMEVGADLLDKRSRARYIHNLKRVGRGARGRFQAAQKNWGSGFARQWSPVSLATRAEAHGMASMYDFYRLASLVTHGSAGGVLGTRRQSKSGKTESTSFRIGPALEIAPVAMMAGLMAHFHFMYALSKVRPDVDMKPYNEPVFALLELWPDYFRALTKIDIDLWPDADIQPPTTVHAIAKSGARRWYIHVPSLGQLLPARPTALPPELTAQLDEISKTVLANPAQYFLPGTEWVSIAIPGLTADQIAGSVLPERARILMPADLPGGWQFVDWPGAADPTGPATDP